MVFALLSIQLSLFAGAAPRLTITSLAKKVELQTGSEKVRAAAEGKTVDDGTVLRTGEGSRVELQIADNVARLGANTVARPEKGCKVLNLDAGLVLIDAGRHARTRRIEFGEVDADIAGCTVVAESHPGIYKMLVLHGTARVHRPGHFADSVLVRAGQLIIGNPKDAVSDPVDFNVARFAGTCRLLTEYPPLPSAPLIAAEGERQKHDKSKKRLIDTNLVIFGKGTAVSVVNDGSTPPANDSEAGPTPPPPPRSKVTSAPGAIDTAVKTPR